MQRKSQRLAKITNIKSSLPFTEHSVISYKNCFYIFGGEELVSHFGYRSPNSHVFTSKKDFIDWKVVSTRGNITPRCRRLHSAVLYDHVMLIFGGIVRDEDYYLLSNNIYEFHFITRQWRKIFVKEGVKPIPRFGHSAIVYENSMIIFGGNRRDEIQIPLSDALYMYHIKESKWSRIVPKHQTSPNARAYHGATCIDDRMYIFGGMQSIGKGKNIVLNDLWEFNIKNSIWRQLLTCNPISSHFMYPIVFSRGNFIYYLGKDINSKRVELYEYSIFQNLSRTCEIEGDLLNSDEYYSYTIASDDKILISAQNAAKVLHIVDLPSFQKLPDCLNTSLTPKMYHKYSSLDTFVKFVFAK